MKVALISPTKFLDVVQPFSDFHLALTHKVIFDHRYQEFYRECSERGDYIVLDNSAAENKGRSVPLKDVVLAAVLIKPKVIVFPDYLFDSDRTLDELENAFKSPQIRFLRRVLPNIKFCAVVQGVDQADWLECFNILNDVNNGIDFLGIPKVTGQKFGSRVNALEHIKKRIKKPCHLFGVWWRSTLDDIAKEARYDFVVGIDTPKPVRLAVYGLPLSRWAEMPRGKNFLDNHYYNVDLELLRSNCADFVELCGGT